MAAASVKPPQLSLHGVGGPWRKRRIWGGANIRHNITACLRREVVSPAQLRQQFGVSDGAKLGTSGQLQEHFGPRVPHRVPSNLASASATRSSVTV